MSEEAKKERGIKEIMDVLDLIEHLAIKGLSAAKDGIGLEDIGVLLDPSLFSKANAALSGLSEADDELKDLSIEEIKQLLDRLIDIVSKAMSSIKSEGEEKPSA